MPFAITLRFDDVSASTIAAMWQLLAKLRLDGDRSQLGYPAHVTLAIYPDDTPSDRLAAAIAAAATNWRTCPVQLTALGFFPSPSAVLCAVPVVTARLLAMHASIQTLLADLEVQTPLRRGCLDSARHAFREACATLLRRLMRYSHLRNQFKVCSTGSS